MQVIKIIVLSFLCYTHTLADVHGKENSELDASENGTAIHLDTIDIDSVNREMMHSNHRMMILHVSNLRINWPQFHTLLPNHMLNSVAFKFEMDGTQLQSYEFLNI